MKNFGSIIILLLISLVEYHQLNSLFSVVYSTPEILSSSIVLIVLFVSVFANNKNLKFFGNLFFMFLLAISYLWNVDKDFIALENQKSLESKEIYSLIQENQKKIDSEKNSIACYTPNTDLELRSFNQCIVKRTQRQKEVLENKARWEKEISEYQIRLDKIERKEARKEVALIKIAIGIIISTIFSFASLTACNILRDWITKPDVGKEEKEISDELELNIPEIDLALEEKIYNLKQAGKSFEQIARELGRAKSSVHWIYTNRGKGNK